MKRINFGQKLLDNRWRPSDQLIQLKGLVEFDERYRYWLGLKDEIKIEEREEEIKKLAKRVQVLRDLLQKHNVADVEAIEEVLQQDREIFLKCRGKNPEDIIENLKQMVFGKKLAVDKTFYEVKIKEKELYDIQSKISMSKEKMTQEEEIVRNKEIEEREKYSASLEYAKTQKDACRITLDSYNKLLGILKNDSRHFDDLLSMLKEDALVQSNAILKMMTLGQMLAEDFSWLKNEAKKHAILWNSDTKEIRLAIKKINNDIKELQSVNAHLREYAAYNYPLFQEEQKAVEDKKEIEVQTLLADLEEFNDKWKKCLNAEEEKDFFPKFLKICRLNETLLKRMRNIRMQRDFQHEIFNKLELVSAELDNCIDESLGKDLADILDVENEIDTIANEMKCIKAKEDEINKEMELYKNYIYQFRRMLLHVFIGPPFGEFNAEIDSDLAAINKLRFENPDFHLSSGSDDEEGTVKEENIEALARNYLDPKATFDDKESFKYETSLMAEEDQIQMLDNVMMQMRTIHECLSSEILSRDPTEEELIGLGDFYAQVQEDADKVIEECMEQEKIVYKKFKPKYDDFHKKSCFNKSRLDIKIENQKILFENEGPVQGLVVNKGALHPPGVIRGMFIPETDSEGEDEMDGEKKEDKDEVKDSEDEVEFIEDEDQAISSSNEEGLDSDLDPDQPKPHICY